MKKILFALSMAFFICLIATNTCKADELMTVRATAYCEYGLTATQTMTRPGVVAFAPEYYGSTVLIWCDGEFLGYYTVEDTGSVKAGVRTGKTIDIWMPTYQECREFGSKQVQIQIIKAEG